MSNIIERHCIVSIFRRSGTSQRSCTAAGTQKSRSHKGSISKIGRFGTGVRNLIFQASARLGQLLVQGGPENERFGQYLTGLWDIWWRKPKEIAPSTPTNYRKGLTSENGNDEISRDM